VATWDTCTDTVSVIDFGVAQCETNFKARSLCDLARAESCSLPHSHLCQSSTFSNSRKPEHFCPRKLD
jgi:hypothetical protein